MALVRLELTMAMYKYLSFSRDSDAKGAIATIS